MAGINLTYVAPSGMLALQYVADAIARLEYPGPLYGPFFQENSRFIHKRRLAMYEIRWQTLARIRAHRDSPHPTF